MNEESEASAEGPGRAAVVSTLLLVAIYVVVSVAAQAFAGTGTLEKNSNDVLSMLGKGVFGSPWNKLLIIAVLTSASASTQTTILPTARTTLSMARWGAIPKVFGDIHPRYLTPTVSTLGMGALSIVWTILLVALNPAQDVLGDSITALGFSICFYYGFTGLACAWYYRHDLFKSVRHFVLVGLLPLAGAVLMFAVFGKAFHDYSQPGRRLLEAAVGHPDPDRDRHRHAAARHPADADLLGQVPAVLPPEDGDRAGRSAGRAGRARVVAFLT